METACVAFWRGECQERRAGRCGTSFERRDTADARQNATLQGRGLLRRGFVEELARIPDTRCALLLPTPQKASGAGDSI
jgi:hypothetical protein